MAGKTQKKATSAIHFGVRGSITRLIRSNRSLFRIYLVFGVTLLVIFTILMVKPIYYKVIMPFNEFLTWSSAMALNVLGGETVSSSGTNLSSNEFSMSLAEGCNGIYALSIVIAGIVAFPARWRPKLIGLVLAIALIMILNYIRILTLWYAGKAGSFLFDTMHLYVWEFIIITLGAAFWYFWYEKFVKKR